MGLSSKALAVSKTLPGAPWLMAYGQYQDTLLFFVILTSVFERFNGEFHPSLSMAKQGISEGHMSSICNDENLKQPSALAYDADPNDWMFWSVVVDNDDNASGFSTAAQISVIPATGVTYVCETGRNRIVKVVSDGMCVPFCGGRHGYRDGPLEEARFAAPSGITVDARGAVIISDTANNCLRSVHLGEVSTIAGDHLQRGDREGVGTYARFACPCGLAVDDRDMDSDGCIYVCDSGNSKIKRVTPEGLVSTFAGSGAVGCEDGIGKEASFNRPFTLVIWRRRLIVADSGNHTLREVDLATGTVRTFAGKGGEPGYTEESALPSGDRPVAEKEVEHQQLTGPSQRNKKKPNCCGNKLLFYFPNGLCIRENDFGGKQGGSALLWIADSHNSAIRQLEIDDVYDDESDEDRAECMGQRCAASKNNASCTQETQCTPHTRRQSTSPISLSGQQQELYHRTPLQSSKDARRRSIAQTIHGDQQRFHSTRNSKTKTRVVSASTLLGGYDKNDEIEEINSIDFDMKSTTHLLKHGDNNGPLTNASLEQPMGLAFNTMLQRLIVSDYHLQDNMRSLSLPARFGAAFGLSSLFVAQDINHVNDHVSDEGRTTHDDDGDDGDTSVASSLSSGTATMT